MVLLVTNVILSSSTYQGHSSPEALPVVNRQISVMDLVIKYSLPHLVVVVVVVLLVM